MSSYRTEERSGTVGACVPDAVSALVELGEECREVVDNAEGGLAETQRIQTLGECADALEYMSEPDVPSSVTDLVVHYHESVQKRKRASPSRNVRRDNAVGMLQASLQVCEEWLDEHEEHDERDDVESLTQELQQMIDDAEGLEFPGMFGC